jgi:1,2-diacylglycerol 3-alpha-glucosyltransferase
MNIALFSDTYLPEINGVATSVSILYNELKKSGHNVYVVTTNPFSNNVEFKDDVLRIPGIELKQLYGYRLASIYSFNAEKIFKSWHIDLIHANTEYSIGIFAKLLAAKFKIPLVYTYHTMIEDYTYYVTKGGTFDYTAKKMVKGISKFYGDTCTELISPSNKTKIALRRYGVENYINVVPTGINIDRFLPSNFKKEELIELRKKYGIEENDFVLLSLGRVANEKNIDIVIKGFDELAKSSKSNVSYKLLVVGSGPALDDLKALAASLASKDRIIFAGRVEQANVPIYYNIANIFCSASVTETQGLTFIEAMAAALPVVAKYDQNLEETLVDGKTGFYFSDEKDFKDKVDVIASMTSTRLEEMKNFCALKAKDFSSTIFKDKILEVYNRAIRKTW